MVYFRRSALNFPEIRQDFREIRLDWRPLVTGVTSNHQTIPEKVKYLTFKGKNKARRPFKRTSGFDGAGGGNRTHGLLITSELLYL